MKMDKIIFSNDYEEVKVVLSNQVKSGDDTLPIVRSSHLEQNAFYYSLNETIGHYDVACLHTSLANNEEEKSFECQNYILGSIVNDDDDVSALTECSGDMNLKKLYEAVYFHHHHHSIPPAVTNNTVPIPVTPNVECSVLTSEMYPPSEILVTVKHRSVQPWSPISYKRNRDSLLGSSFIYGNGSISHEEKQEHDVEKYFIFEIDEEPSPCTIRRCNAFDEDDEKRRFDHSIDSNSFIHQPYHSQRFDIFTRCRYRLSRPSSLHLNESSAWFFSNNDYLIDNNTLRRSRSYPPPVPPLTPKHHHTIPTKRKNFKNISLKKRWALRFRHSF